MITGPEQVTWLDRLESEHDNLRAALDWSQRQDPRLALRLCGALWRFWRLRGYLSEGRRRLESTLARVDRPPSSERAKALHGLGALALAHGDREAARPVLEESLALWQETGDRDGIAGVLNDLGNLAMRGGDLAAARALYDNSISIYRATGNTWGTAIALNNHGHILRGLGEHEAARTAFEEALLLARRIGDRRGAALALHNLGTAARDRDELDSARTLQEEALALWRELGDRWAAAGAVNHVAVTAQRRGDLAGAARLYAESLVLMRELGDSSAVPVNLSGLAAVAAGLGRPAAAARLFGGAETLFMAAGTRLSAAAVSEIERSRASIRAALGDTAMETAWRAGRLLSTDQAVAEALMVAVAAPVEAATPAADAVPAKPILAIPLSGREREVLRLIVAGRKNREIAEELVLSVRTVESHVFNTYAKMGARGRADAVAFALRHALV